MTVKRIKEMIEGLSDEETVEVITLATKFDKAILRIGNKSCEVDIIN